MLSVTLKTHHDKSVQTPSVSYGSTIRTMIDNFNQYRKSDSQLVKLYNPHGQEIPNHLWTKLQIKENMIFFVDMP
jgi:hypothetical protein